MITSLASFSWKKIRRQRTIFTFIVLGFIAFIYFEINVNVQGTYFWRQIGRCRNTVEDDDSLRYLIISSHEIFEKLKLPHFLVYGSVTALFSSFGQQHTSVLKFVPLLIQVLPLNSSFAIAMSKRKSDVDEKVTKEELKVKKSKDSEKAGKSDSKESSSKGSTDEIPRDKDGKLIFKDCPEFKPNLTPKEVMQLGSFGGTYFRPIESSITKEKYSGVWKEFPADWFENLNIKTQVASPTYKNQVNKYQVKCGGSLQMWEESGWITKQDPYGWFQWYCRFYLGRRTEDDTRQIKRWLNCAGPKGRWKNNLIAKCVRANLSYSDKAVSPVVRQTLQHWGYVLTEKDYKAHAKNVKT